MIKEKKRKEEKKTQIQQTNKKKVPRGT